VPWKRLEDLGLEYRYIALFLQSKISNEEMLAVLESESKKFAKRQMTWLKRDKSIHWFKPEEKERMLKGTELFLNS